MEVRGYFVHAWQGPHGRPLDWGEGLRALSELSGLTPEELECCLRALGHRAKRHLEALAREGEMNEGNEPLSPYTYFRKLKGPSGRAAGSFTYETGGFYRALRVQLLKGGRRKRGLIAVGLLPRGRSARGLGYLNIFNIWRAGLVVEATDPEAKRRMVAWIAANIPEAGVVRGLDPSLRNRGGPIYIVIPPRDPLPPGAGREVSRRLERELHEELSGRYSVLSGLLEYEPWDPASASRWRAALIRRAEGRLAAAM